MTGYSLVGATGGAGTTRLALEFGALLARGGHDVAVLDAAYATQGLVDHCPTYPDADVTELALDPDAPLEAGLVDFASDAEGRLAVCPARAPFERLARAKTPEAARRFEARIEEAGGRFDYVLVDTPPVAANQAVAAVTACASVSVVAPPGQRGRAALVRARDRLADLGVEVDSVVVNRPESVDDAPDADAVVPESTGTDPAAVPVCAAADGPFAAGVADAVTTLFGVRVEVEVGDDGVRERLRSLRR
ncbi:ParA family protein [Halomarina halobia]|uniref:ParA family protein n=1 Tax=Halomarina halobia TaxID=3033386 RepID=A0ABD6AAV6_9EURY|nr:ParA family protein [Halomarina sp. PSR21]